MLPASWVVDFAVVLTKGALDTGIELADALPDALLEEVWLEDTLVRTGTEVVLVYIGIVAEGDETMLLMLLLALLGITEVDAVEELMLDVVYVNKEAVPEVIDKLFEEAEVVRAVKFIDTWLKDRVVGKFVEDKVVILGRALLVEGLVLHSQLLM